MEIAQNACLRCKGEMVPGYLIDSNDRGDALSRWYEGKPTTRIFGKLRVPPEKEGLPLAAFRCKLCGYVELYADRRFEAQ